VHSIAKGPDQSVTEITDHLAEARDRVRIALERAGRTSDAATILAVSKQQPVAAIESAFRAGQLHFGESYVQEALPKIAALKELSLQWHFIGRPQTNKTRAIAEHFQWVHTVSELKTAVRLNAQRPHFAPELNVLIQVNQGTEHQKGGVARGELSALAHAVAALPRLRLRGLMSIPPTAETAAESRPYFRELRTLKKQLEAEGLILDALSMGMSADFETAIAEGATWVRLGTIIFGPRR
jgi:PLP dependent protein